MTVRSRIALTGFRAGCLLASAGLLAGLLPPAAGNESFHAPSTLAPQVAPQPNSLDATILSMVNRGILPDVRPAHTSARNEAPPAMTAPTPAPPASAATPLAPTPRLASSSSAAKAAAGKWRPAGSGSLTAPQAAEEAFSEPQFPTLPTTPEASAPALAPVDAGPSLPLASTVPTLPTAEPAPVEPQGDGIRLHAPIKLEGPAIAPSPGDDEEETGAPIIAAPANDEMAPIDDFSATAPATDAPGDPQEPEYTGAAADDSTTTGARPLSEAPQPSSTTGNIALGEPDRYSRPSDRVDNPTDPKSFEEADEPSAAQPKRALSPLTKNQILLRNKVRQVLKYYYNRPLVASERSPWEVMHGMLAYEVHSRVLQGGGKSQPITAVGWLCFNQPCENRTLMYLNEDGDLRVKVGPALQGHHGQLLALLAQARVRSDYPLKVEGKDFTVNDLIEVEKLTCYPKTELTFKLIGLQRYLDINDTWVNDQGMQWDFPKLMAEEMAQPVRTAACGGTHRLAGLALAVKKRKAAGLPIDGQYAAAQKFVANYQNYAYRLQNSDGSFSTDWFKGSAADPDIDRRLKTTGHQLELLIYAGSDEQLNYYRTVRAVNYLANIMHANRTRDWEAGPLGHAIHALVLYDRLAFGPYDAAPDAGPVATAPGHTQR
ncbi:hypothetical protein [Lacipirellula limnantheis]|uniref:Prenyltransferase and squalene oxidase repeat protein n=1 Tax=Lacipirellula limnantheis TaxID=2528024 RepID=A0A517TT22_9BACT|nr:hypothetical protein [Lacipirellula limnantheis]QDT71521.1 hypothetical protein I41_06790 [Lacipirellula limnantheis]